METLAAIRNGAKFYGDRKVFGGLNCDFRRGSLCVALGSNGAGKTTLLKILAGLTKLSEGEMEIKRGARVGYFAHASFVYPGLTAAENLKFWARAYGADLGGVEPALQKVGLAARADDPARSFSRGMLQRLNFARLLLQKPDLWLLDEPFSGLDEESQSFMRRELKNIKGEGACVVVVSHDPRADLPLADCSLKMGGRPVFSPVGSIAGAGEN